MRKPSGYTPLGFLIDHQTMLHCRETPPWKVPKYSKRLLRYVLFLLMHTMSDTSRTFDARLAALEALVGYTSSLSHVEAGRMRATRFGAVNAFAAQERRTLVELAEGSRRDREAYLRTLHRHLARLVSFVKHAFEHRFHPPTYRSHIDITHLDYMDRHLIPFDASRRA